MSGLDTFGAVVGLFFLLVVVASFYCALDDRVDLAERCACGYVAAHAAIPFGLSILRLVYW